MEEPEQTLPLVTFLSDFGTDDTFVGLCHAAVFARCPTARVIDLSHTVAAQDVTHGAARLEDAVAWVGQPAVHMAVVDPGVGTERRGLAVACGESLLVGPDNGLLMAAAERLGGITGAWALLVPAGASATFHGRDVFAPAAGWFAAGVEPSALGQAVDPADLTPEPGVATTVTSGHVESPVRDVDRFGNLQLAVRPSDLAAAGAVEGAGVEVGVRGRSLRARVVRTFGDLEPGGLGLLEDAFGWSALALAHGSAAAALEAGLHVQVTLRVDLSRGAPEA